MIKSLRVQDFESHKNTELVFGEGLNVIHGTSNVGKSALFRALELASYGEWAGGEDPKNGKNGPVRAGSKHCVVDVETERGKVTVKKGTGVNEWEVTNEKGTRLIESPGTGVPPEANQVIGLETREIAGLKIRFNWSDQRDKHFLLDEVGGRSASPSLVAAVLDEIAGIGGFEDLVRELANEKSSEEKETKKARENVEKLSDELTVYDYVDEQLKIVQKVDDAFQRARKTNVLVEKAQRLSSSLETNKSKTDEIRLKLIASSHLPAMISACDVLRDKIKKLSKTHDDLLLVKRTKKKLDDCCDRLSGVKNRIVGSDKTYSQLIRLSDDLVKKRKEWERVNDARRHLVTVVSKLSKHYLAVPHDTSCITPIIEKVKDKTDRLLKLNNAAEEDKRHRQKTTRVVQCVNRAKDLHSTAKKELDDFVGTIETCPITGAPFAQECRNYLTRGDA